MIPPRIWLWACMGWCVVWTLPVQASWETYQRAGEAAYSRGDYTTARRMFLAAVREARHFGPQDPRLDISLNKLALLRVGRSAHSRARVQTRRVTRSKSHVRKPGLARHSRRRQAARPVPRHSRAGRQPHALRSARPAERRKSTQTTVARPAHRAQRPRGTLHRAKPARRVAPPVRHGRQREAVRTPRRETPRRETPRRQRETPRRQRETPRRQHGRALQRPHTTHRHPEATAGRRTLSRSRQP